ncbi:ATP synthase F0, A subunit [candidate division TM7 genomosp. GTL1]|nr:ATP synthase F0, A subunit [candidate division TM7 genomosp. GTL1]
MLVRHFKSFTVAVSSLFLVSFFNVLNAQEKEGGHPSVEQTEKGHEKEGERKGFNASEVIFGHVLNAHEFHFVDIGDHPVSIPLPVILYSPQRGFTSFMSSRFEHGHHDHEGYKILTEHSIAEMGLDKKVYNPQDIVAVDEHGKIDTTVKVYDLSLTRNVVQMLIALFLFTWIMLRIAKRYKSGVGVTSAPRGSQSLMEPVITFVRDEVAKPNLGHKQEKYLPYLLTVFFFILINNLFGLIPGSANVTGNIAFTVVLGLISFVVILASTNRHYWGHIFNPPGVPFGVKLILVPVEFLSVFIKPFALIIRLFANMVAGHIIIICLISLIFIFAQLSPIAGWGASPLAVGFTVFIYFIEVLVAFIQAFIFAMLTAVFIGQAFEGGHDDVDHHEEAIII